MRNFQPKIEKQAQIKESLDRPGIFPKGELAPDEDEELVNLNNPKNKYVKPEDIADNSYLAYGEEQESDLSASEIVEEEEDLSEAELNELAVIRAKNEADKAASPEYTVKQVYPENTGKIGAASVSAHEQEILVSRDPAKKEDEMVLRRPLSSEEKNLLAKKYENQETEPASNKIRAEAYRDYMSSSKIEARSNTRHGQSHRGDNLKTETASKRERRHRGFLRRVMESLGIDSDDEKNWQDRA